MAEPEVADLGQQRVLPSRWAISMVPRLEDWARIWLAVRTSLPCDSASWKV